MSSRPRLDPQSFEALLASAFQVQQSGLSPESLSAMRDAQRFIASPENNTDDALHFIAERTLNISHASGVAIALVESNELVYRAGSGSAAIQIGRHVPAVLCARSDLQAEILRVEDAQNDSRVQADICKQFEATSLLILPIYENRLIAGVLQIHFSEAHAFLEHEVRAYRLMAGLIQEAILRNSQSSTNEAPAVTVSVIENPISAQQLSVVSQPPTQIAAHPPLQPTARATMGWAALSTVFARRLGHNFNRIFAKNARPVAVMVTLAILLAMAIQIAHRHGTVPSKVVSTYSIPTQTMPNAAPSQVDTSSKGFSPETKNGTASKSAFTRVDIGPNEVDYVADDVTIRQFRSRPPRPQTRASDRQVEIGEDVTIRYFSNKSTSDSQPALVPASSHAAR